MEINKRAYSACKKGDVDALEKAIAEGARDYNGMLRIACLNGHFETFECVYERVNYKFRFNDWKKYIEYTIRGQSIDIIQVLIRDASASTHGIFLLTIETTIKSMHISTNMEFLENVVRFLLRQFPKLTYRAVICVLDYADKTKCWKLFDIVSEHNYDSEELLQLGFLYQNKRMVKRAIARNAYGVHSYLIANPRHKYGYKYVRRHRFFIAWAYSQGIFHKIGLSKVDFKCMDHILNRRLLTIEILLSFKSLFYDRYDDKNIDYWCKQILKQRQSVIAHVITITQCFTCSDAARFIARFVQYETPPSSPLHRIFN